LDNYGTFCTPVPLLYLQPNQRFIEPGPIPLFQIQNQGCYLHSGRVWIGHSLGSLLEGNVQIYAQNADGSRITCIGEVYLHKHTGAYAHNDYFDFAHLAKITPMPLDVGDLIWCKRDVHNISLHAFNCFDLEIRINVSWPSAWTPFSLQ